MRSPTPLDAGVAAGPDGPTWYTTAMAQEAPRSQRARPVAGVPLDGLLAGTEQIAKGWALALVEQAPLPAAPGILTEAFTRDGPRVCDAAVRALADDGDLRRLAPGGALRGLAASIGEMTGGHGPGDAARAVDALSNVVWAALREALRAPSPDLVTGLAERLALVCSHIRDGAIEGAPDGGREAVRTQSADAGRGEPARDVPEPEPDPGPAAVTPVTAASQPLWLSALGDEVRGSGSGGRPLSLLLAELEDADRVLASTSPARAGLAFGNFVAALRRVLRDEDILVCEDDARAWVIARQTARAGAHLLGARIAEAVGETSSVNGAPLVACVGVAVLGEDGESPDELIEAAEEARFSASARGIEVSRRVPERDRG
jgi:hypothetical protein